MDAFDSEKPYVAILVLVDNPFGAAVLIATVIRYSVAILVLVDNPFGAEMGQRL